MELHPHHIKNVSHTKSFNERSLEEPILKVHQGDQQVYTGRGQYRYLHRPLPQTSDKQPLHLLHPKIDSGSVFLSEKHYNPEWHHTRADIPNSLHSNKEVANYREKSFKYHTGEIETEDHAKHMHQKYRYHPVYDQPHVPGDSLDAIHHHNHPDHPLYIDGYAKNKSNVHDVAVHQRHKGTDKIKDTYNNPIHHDSIVEKDKSILVEGYTRSGLGHRELGRYGNPRPDAYSNMEKTPVHNNEYNRIAVFEEKVPLNKPSKYEYYKHDIQPNNYHMIFIFVILLLSLFGIGFSLYHGIKKGKKPRYIKIAHIHPRFLVN